MRWLILCDDCTREVDEGKIAGIFEAKFGPVESDEDIEGAILACQHWNLPRENEAMQFFCDECGDPVAVAKSSGWFVDEHRKERDL